MKYDILLALNQVVVLGTALCYAVFIKIYPISNLNLLLLHGRPLNEFVLIEKLKTLTCFSSLPVKARAIFQIL